MIGSHTVHCAKYSTLLCHNQYVQMLATPGLPVLITPQQEIVPQAEFNTGGPGLSIAEEGEGREKPSQRGVERRKVGGWGDDPRT